MSGMCVDQLSQIWAWHSGQCVRARNTVIYIVAAFKD